MLTNHFVTPLGFCLLAYAAVRLAVFVGRRVAEWARE